MTEKTSVLDAFENMENRVFLDFPIDILLNRECMLRDYENELRDMLVALDADAKRLFPMVEGAATISGRAHYLQSYKLILRFFRDETGEARENLKRELSRKENGDPLDERDPKNLRIRDAIDSFCDKWQRDTTEATRKKIKEPFLSGKLGSIILPGKSNPGTGNILVRGHPGTGKSTLALQIAMGFAFEPNDFSSFYIALEEPIEHIKHKYRGIDTWVARMHQMNFLDCVDESSSPMEMGLALERIITQPGSCPLRALPEHMPLCKPGVCHRQERLPAEVLFPRLSPRNISAGEGSGDYLFWERFKQLERLFQAAEWLRKKRTIPEIRLACIDSLNVFGDAPLDRNKVCRLFDLCEQYQIIGLFTIEDKPSIAELFSSEVIDVLIDLTAEDDNSYALRYFEIAKSRYQHQVYGKHPFKIRDEEKWSEKKEYAKRFYVPIKILPSLHHVVAATNSGDLASDKGFPSGDCDLTAILPPGFPRNSVLLIKGPRGSYKSVLARNFLLAGVADFESVLHIQLNEHPSLALPDDKDVDPNEWIPRIAKRWRISGHLLAQDGSERIKWSRFTPCPENHVSNSKMVRAVHKYADGDRSSIIVQLALKGGALLPEEFLDIARSAFRMARAEGRRIQRVVLDDVSLIGASYPYLRKSKTAGDLFLSSFLHVMRNFGNNNVPVDVVVVGTTGEFKDGDDIVNRACSLADSVLTTEYRDVFGDQYVIVTGEGLTVGEGDRGPLHADDRNYGENIPGVIIPEDSKLILGKKQKTPVTGSRPIFRVNRERLQGFVGFDTGHVHRPGLTLQLFQESEIQKKYNSEIELLVRSSFGYPSGIGTKRIDSPDNQEVVIRPFDPSQSEAVHDSLNVLMGKPLDRTFVCMIDEFFKSSKDALSESLVCIDGLLENREFIEGCSTGPAYMMPYSANVFLLAYRNDRSFGEFGERVRRSWKHSSGPREHFSWKDIQDALVLSQAKDNSSSAPSVGGGFDFDVTAAESMSCIVIDAILSGSEQGCMSLRERLRQCDGDNDRESAIYDVLVRKKKKLAEVTDWEKISAAICKELKALNRLFATTKRNIADLDSFGATMPAGDMENRSGGIGERALHPDATLYLCWYSQLRVLLHDHPEISSKIDIMPLPGGGFRGDWYLGIRKGSASVSLGKDIIMLLGSETEDYKRYVRGVGMPVLKRFYPNLHAKAKQRNGEEERTLSAFTSIPLRTALLFYKEAHIRSQIEHYEKFRHYLYSIGRKLAYLAISGASLEESDEFIEKTVAEIPEIIGGVLCK